MSHCLRAVTALPNTSLGLQALEMACRILSVPIPVRKDSGCANSLCAPRRSREKCVCVRAYL